MSHWRLDVVVFAGAILSFAAVSESHAALLSLTAVVSDRGIDTSPRDGVFDSVFGNSSVTQITTPPSGNTGAEERTAIEFSLAGLFPTASVIDTVTLLLSPQGNGTNLGLGAGEAAEVHGYAGDGAIQTTDMTVNNLVGGIGPTPDGQVAVTLSAAWLQSLIDANDLYAGLMFKGVDGPAAVLFNFAGTFAGIDVADRPTLLVEYHSEGPPVPEPSTLSLVALGATALAIQRRRRAARMTASVR